MENDRLLREYIGKNADEIMTGKYNTVAGILGWLVGPVWFFYRKMYMIGFLCLLFSFMLGFMVSIFIPSYNGSALSVIFGLMYGGFGNKIYLWDANRKIQKIRDTNSFTSEEEIIQKIREKGGTSTLAAVIYGIILFAIMSGIILLYMLSFVYMTHNM